MNILQSILVLSRLAVSSSRQRLLLNADRIKVSSSFRLIWKILYLLDVLVRERSVVDLFSLNVRSSEFVSSDFFSYYCHIVCFYFVQW